MVYLVVWMLSKQKTVDPNNKFASALQLASYRGDMEMVKELVDKFKADVNSTGELYHC